MLSQFNRGANCFRPFLWPRGDRRFRLHFLRTAPCALLLALCVCVALPALGQNQSQTEPAAPPASSAPSPSAQSSSSQSSSSSATGSSSDLRRSFESRRQETKLRREAQAVTDTYTHRWEVYTGGSYLRFRPGPALHNSGVAGWTLGFTRYFTPRFGITADARGYYGSNSLGPTNGGGFNTYNASFSVFPFTIGPQYRFYGNPKFSISGAVQAGIIYGYFDANTNGIPPELVGFYPASVVGAAIGNLNLDYNLSPGLALRIAPQVLFDHFGGNTDHNQGFLVGIVYRFGRQ